MKTKKLLLLLTLNIGLVTTLMVSVKKVNKFTMPMFWIDGRDRDDFPPEIDTFFDRCVCIYNKINRTVVGDNLDKYFTNEVTGVFLTENLILTSYNPFRDIVTNKSLLKSFEVKTVNGRFFRDVSHGAFSYWAAREKHVWSSHNISCARQVVPPFDFDPLPSDMRHGVNSPLHDLMVLRVNKSVTFLQPLPKRKFDFQRDYEQSKWERRQQAYLYKGYSPIKTIIAEPGDKIDEKDMLLASIAHLHNIHVFENRYLEQGNTTSPDGEPMLTDCDEWIPREWGHFFCMRNVHKYKGIASGGVLFSGYKLFGLGSFAIWRGNRSDESILVFTDLRPYRKHFYMTCTPDDQNLQWPEKKIPWWWWPWMGDFGEWFADNVDWWMTPM